MNYERLTSLSNLIYLSIILIITFLKIFGFLQIGNIEFALAVVIITNLINVNNIILIKSKIK